MLKGLKKVIFIFNINVNHMPKWSKILKHGENFIYQLCPVVSFSFFKIVLGININIMVEISKLSIFPCFLFGGSNLFLKLKSKKQKDWSFSLIF